MKKILKITGLILSAIALLAIFFLLYVKFSPSKTYKYEIPEISVSKDSLSLENGKDIVIALCKNCHMSDDGKLGGAFMEKGPIGNIFAPNITNDIEYGVGKYTEGELLYLLRTGIANDGRYIPPIMVKLPHMSDEDIEDVIAFLKSDDFLVSPSKNEIPKTEYGLLAKMLMKLGAFGPLPYPEEEILRPSIDDEVELGKYLAVGVYDCYSCHSKSFTKINLMEPEKTPGFFGGGNMMSVSNAPNAEVIPSANLTFDTHTGIGNWTKSDFIKALRTGVKPDGTTLRSPMVPYNNLSDKEAGAIYEYLKSLPIITNKSLKAEM